MSSRERPSCYTGATASARGTQRCTAQLLSHRRGIERYQEPCGTSKNKFRTSTGTGPLWDTTGGPEPANRYISQIPPEAIDLMPAPAVFPRPQGRRVREISSKRHYSSTRRPFSSRWNNRRNCTAAVAEPTVPARRRGSRGAAPHRPHSAPTTPDQFPPWPERGGTYAPVRLQSRRWPNGSGEEPLEHDSGQPANRPQPGTSASVELAVRQAVSP